MSDPSQCCQPTIPRRCARGCGFFGSPENKFLCSKCYNDYLKEENAKPATVTVSETRQDSATNPSSFVTGGVTSPPNPAATDSTAAPAKSNRCSCCKKKVGLMSFQCRCGGTFCGRHRYAEEHKCEFDFKAMGRNILAEENPVTVADKLQDRV